MIKYEGTRPVNDPPEDQLFQSESVVQTEDSGQDCTGQLVTGVHATNHHAADLDVADHDAAGHDAAVQNTRKRAGKSIQRRSNKRARLVDVVKSSNDQFEELQKTLSNSVLTPEMREVERQEDREFFKEIFSNLCNTMVGMTQMLTQACHGASQHVPFGNPIYPQNTQFSHHMTHGFQPHVLSRSSSPYSSSPSDRVTPSPHTSSCEDIDLDQFAQHD